MDPLLLKYYNQELQYIREMGGEFAAQFPKIAGRLGLDGVDCSDPYVERLLEGFAFLTARVQLKLDAEFPRFTHHLLEMVYPHYLCQTPSMTIVRMQPDPTEGSLSEGFDIPRGTSLRSVLGAGDQTACEFRTAHAIKLWPLELHAAAYYSRDVAAISLPPTVEDVRAAIQLRFRTTAGLKFNEIALDRLPIFIRGNDERAMSVYEQVFANASAVIVRPPDRTWSVTLPASSIQAVGFDKKDALLPYADASFDGYRLLQEYFAFHQRFLFFELSDLKQAVGRCSGNELEVVILMDRVEMGLENAVNASQFELFCTPAVNLFPRRADRIHVDQRKSQHHVVPDRTRPMDLEVYRVERVVGLGETADEKKEFRPFYATRNQVGHADAAAYYTVDRSERILSSRQKSGGTRSSYVGSEVYLSLVDGEEAPYSAKIRQLDVEVLCTNRDLPLMMPVGRTNTDFTLEIGAPVVSIRCVAGPTEPRPAFSYAGGDTVWRLISHLSLNYLSLVDDSHGSGASALRDLLKLYVSPNDAAQRMQIEGLRSISTEPIIRRLPYPGPITYGRGLQATLVCDDTAFEGSGIYLFGAVLAQFLAKYASINSFTETVLRSTDRGEIKKWAAIPGRRHVI